MLVTGIRPDGAVTAWNESNASLALKRGDRIVSVNRISGTVDELVAQIQAAPYLHVQVERAPKWVEMLAAFDRQEQAKAARQKSEGRTTVGTEDLDRLPPLPVTPTVTRRWPVRIVKGESLGLK